MTDDTAASMRAIIDGRDRYIATLEDEIFILKRQLAEHICARRITEDELLNYTEGLEMIDGQAQTKNGVEVFVAAEEDFQEIKDAIADYHKKMSIEERLALEEGRAKMKQKKVIVGRDAQLADRDAEIADLKRQLATGIRARRVTMDEYSNYMGKLEYIKGRMVANGVEVLVAESENFLRLKEDRDRRGLSQE
jgi:hypothetical protein